MPTTTRTLPYWRASGRRGREQATEEQSGQPPNAKAMTRGSLGESGWLEISVILGILAIIAKGPTAVEGKALEDKQCDHKQIENTPAT